MSVALDGFLVALSASDPARGWPRPEAVGDAEVWYHGYLAEPARLRRELALDASASCARILDAGWRRWRDELPERIHGEFAAVIVSGGEAVLLGDRMALRPLYYAHGPHHTVVSTDLGALVRETQAWRELDEDYLADVLCGSLHLGPRTPYRAVRRVEVGEFATWAPGRLDVRGGWRPAAEPTAGTFAEHQELLRATVDRAVAGALSGEGTQCVELSGGLDTSTVLAVAAQHSPVHALSFVHPGDPGSDERPWMQAALESTPATWHPIDATEHGIFTAGPEFDVFLPAPSRGILNWASSAAEDAVAAELGGVTIVTGEGGDAVFFAGLMPWYLADLLRNGHVTRLRQEARRWSEHAEPRRSSAFWMRRAAVDGLRSWRSGRTLALEPRRSVEVAAPWLNREYVHGRALQPRTEVTTALRAPTVHGQAVLENVLRCAEFARTRTVFTSSARHPLLAPVVVDLAMTTPPHVAVDPRIDRAVQRYAFRGLVDDAVLRRRSKPLADEAVLRGFERSPRWRSYLCERPHVVERGYVDPDAWDRALRSVGRVGGLTQLYAAIQVEVWLRHLHHAGPPQLLA